MTVCLLFSHFVNQANRLSDVHAVDFFGANQNARFRQSVAKRHRFANVRNNNNKRLAFSIIGRQKSPLATHKHEIQHAVDNLPKLNLEQSADLFRQRKEIFDIISLIIN